MSYRYSFEDLLAVLHGHAPAKVDAVALHRRRVEHGHLSVGLKIHCLDDAGQFTTLVEGLGGAHKILDVNSYKHSHAPLCLVPMYQASGVEQFAPGRHGYPRASDGPRDRNGGRVSDIAPAMAAKPVSRTITSRLASNSSCAWACSVL